ncbi:homoserine kinase [Flavobacterium cerinum]|uniref:Homoserine kinase n=1 Tax=Flavobacterium cerinum TaxID=2502784 RepID=A0ABY5IQA8_9FLAO|nr:homoserine kinase [Flavobacterium cerinum]UUC44392.1 homoserine kinase [Flavobacterium cerinum]
MESIRLFCPATVANISCGFDVLGLCLDTIGDEMTITKTAQKGIQITRITGADLPLDVTQNVAGIAAQAFLEQLGTDQGFAIEIHKKIKAGSGIGSSAASAAGAVFGLNALCGNPFTNKELISFAMKGEALASGCEHADNVAPALLGGFTLIRGYEPLDVIALPVPSELYVTVIHPQIALKTAEMRAVLAPEIPLKNAIAQWGNLGGFIAGLYTEDYNLMQRSLSDKIVEPVRSPFIPGFDKIKETALQNGALGAGISGSGPSIFTLNKGIKTAKKVAFAIAENYTETGIPFEVYTSPINKSGVRIINR